jgi:hypothetical protein
MLSEEARIGKRVRIRADHRSLPLRGLEGTIEKRWGNPDHVAVDVLFDDGTRQLIWPGDLEEIFPSSPKASWWGFLLGGNSAG